MSRDPWWLRHTVATVALGLGLTTMAVGIAVDYALPGKLPAAGEPVTTELRINPCATCGRATPITIFLPDGGSVRVTEPGSFEEMGRKYCPAVECLYKLG